MYKMIACCTVGYTNDNEANIHQINLNCTFYINYEVRPTKYTNSRAYLL